MDNIYEMLSSLPLFGGVTKEKMNKMAGSTKFHFLKFLPGQQFINAGDKCQGIECVISGSVKLAITNRDGRFMVEQTLHAPDVIAPEFVFGRSTVYPCTVTAVEPTGILRIDKTEYVRILNSDPIFLYNYLNRLSMNAQKAIDGVLAVATGSLEERIAFWIVAMTQVGATDVRLVCRQRDLYALFGVQRSSFIATLDDMKSRGLLNYTSNEISVNDRKAVIEILHSKID